MGNKVVANGDQTGVCFTKKKPIENATLSFLVFSFFPALT